MEAILSVQTGLVQIELQTLDAAGENERVGYSETTLCMNQPAQIHGFRQAIIRICYCVD